MIFFKELKFEPKMSVVTISVFCQISPWQKLFSAFFAREPKSCAKMGKCNNKKCLIQIFTKVRENEEDVERGEEHPAHPIHLLPEPGVSQSPTPMLETGKFFFEGFLQRKMKTSL